MRQLLILFFQEILNLEILEKEWKRGQNPSPTFLIHTYSGHIIRTRTWGGEMQVDEDFMTELVSHWSLVVVTKVHVTFQISQFGKEIANDFWCRREELKTTGSIFCSFVFWPMQILYTSHNKTVAGYFISVLFKSKDHYVFPLAVSTMVLQQNRGNENLCLVL